MKRIFLLITAITIALCNVCRAQTRIDASEAKNYIGKEVQAMGTVIQITKMTKVIYLNIDSLYPNNPLTAVIFAADTAKFKNIDDYQGKKVIITGKVTTYKNKPQIVLKEDKQIKIK